MPRPSNSLFRHHFLSVDKARRRADALHIAAAATAVRSVEGWQRGEATVHGAEPAEAVRREHVVHQREAQERWHDILRMWWSVMMVSTAAGVAIRMASTVTWIDLLENLVERTAAEEFPEDFLWVAEHEWEAAEDEVGLEGIVLRVSSSVVVAIASFVVS